MKWGVIIDGEMKQEGNFRGRKWGVIPSELNSTRGNFMGMKWEVIPRCEIQHKEIQQV